MNTVSKACVMQRFPMTSQMCVRHKIIRRIADIQHADRLPALRQLQQSTRLILIKAEPGDLIFFQGTYNTSGASHVGIYVGNGMMIHCGNPISYASIETSYWQEHFYCFGRIRD